MTKINNFIKYTARVQISEYLTNVSHLQFVLSDHDQCKVCRASLSLIYHFFRVFFFLANYLMKKPIFLSGIFFHGLDSVDCILIMLFNRFPYLYIFYKLVLRQDYCIGSVVFIYQAAHDVWLNLICIFSMNKMKNFN